MRNPPPGARGRRWEGRVDDAICETRRTWFFGRGFVETPVYRRDRLPLGCSFPGPAIIEQMDATTLVLPGSGIRLDQHGNLMIQVGIATA
jgi:N-methylhydantoinase A